MTEEDWLTPDTAYLPLIYVREFASVRKLKLVASAYVRWLQTLPAYIEDRPCAEIIEMVADKDKEFEELQALVWKLPGGTGMRLTGVLFRDNVGAEVSKLVAFANVPENPQLIHATMIALLHEVFGNPFKPVTIDPRWLTSTVVDLATAIYDEKAFDRMPILADALMDAGCDNEEIIAHCRGDGPHVRGCFVVDLLLDKQ